MSPNDAVRSILNRDQTGSFDQFGGPKSRRGKRHNAVRVAVNDERRHVDAPEIFAEILVPAWHAGKTRCGRGSSGDVPASLNRLLADALTQQHVRVEEILEELRKEDVTVCHDRFLNAFEYRVVHALAVVVRFQQERPNRPDEYGLSHSRGPAFP